MEMLAISATMMAYLGATARKTQLQSFFHPSLYFHVIISNYFQAEESQLKTTKQDWRDHSCLKKPSFNEFKRLWFDGITVLFSLFNPCHRTKDICLADGGKVPALYTCSDCCNQRETFQGPCAGTSQHFNRSLGCCNFWLAHTRTYEEQTMRINEVGAKHQCLHYGTCQAAGRYRTQWTAHTRDLKQIKFKARATKDKNNGKHRQNPEKCCHLVIFENQPLKKDEALIPSVQASQV